MGRYTKREYRVEHRYDYFAIDEYSYDALADTWNNTRGPLFTGTRKDCARVASELNEAYYKGATDGNRPPTCDEWVERGFDA